MIDYISANQPVNYPQAVDYMEKRVALIEQHHAGEQIWFLEHPAIITAGSSAKPQDLLSDRFTVYQSRRGGQYTYHGPGQLIAYTMLDLRHRGQNIRQLVCNLEQVVINTLAQYDISAVRRDGRVGIWLSDAEMARHLGAGQVESKIAAIGLRVRKWVAFHGISINLNPDLSHYSAINPCGLQQFGVTSLSDLGKAVDRGDFERALQANFNAVLQGE